MWPSPLRSNRLLLLPLLLQLSASIASSSSAASWSGRQLSDGCHPTILQPLHFYSTARVLTIRLTLSTTWMVNEKVLVMADQLPGMISASCVYQGFVMETGGSAFASVANGVLRATLKLGRQWYGVRHRLDSRRPAIAVPMELNDSAESSSGAGRQAATPAKAAAATTEEPDSSDKGDGDVLSRRRRELRLHALSGTEPNKMVEIAVVANSDFVYKHGGVAGAVQRIIEIMNLVNGIYQPLGLHVILNGVTLWSHDYVNANMEDHNAVLNQFGVWKANFLTVRHDTALLLTENTWGSVLGAAVSHGACQRVRGAVIVADSQWQAMDTALTAAHEIGHNLGFRHVDRQSCHCSTGRCVMDAVHMSDENRLQAWSSCTVEAWRQQANSTWRLCLRHAPQLPDSVGGSVCGNGIVEPGEECDCGSQLTSASNCCNAITCQLLPGASCGSGPCCNLTTCQLLPAATTCRAAHGHCDLPETCSGASEWCPADEFKADGVLCSEGQAHCYDGECRTRAAQCRMLMSNWEAHPDCYDLNRYARYGLCNFTFVSAVYTSSGPQVYNTRQACARREDASCGLLMCSGVPDGVGTMRLRISGGIECFCPLIENYDFHQAGRRSPSLVPDGAACGADRDKMCVNSRCTELPLVAGCSNNGVATSGGRCFCHRGFAPPDCVRPGCGGSDTSPLQCHGAQ